MTVSRTLEGMDLPVMPPVAPMLAKPVPDLPEGAWSFEPKWDGSAPSAGQPAADVAPTDHQDVHASSLALASSGSRNPSPAEHGRPIGPTDVRIRRSEAPGLPVSHCGCLPRLSTWGSEAGGRPVSSATASDIVSQRRCRMDSNMVV